MPPANVTASLRRVVRKTRKTARRQFQAARGLPRPKLAAPSVLATLPGFRTRVFSVSCAERDLHYRLM